MMVVAYPFVLPPPSWFHFGFNPILLAGPNAKEPDTIGITSCLNAALMHCGILPVPIKN